jgi:predicted N-acetyltransferase YhbS
VGRDPLYGAVMDGVRRARPADVEQIVALQVDRNGAEWEGMVRSLLDDPDVGPDRFTVAVDGGRVVSSLCLLSAALRVGGVDVAVGQPEFVATRTDHERRGLVRAQMDLVHRWSAERGDLAQIIAGIPYFYRRFGYEYAIEMPRLRLVDPAVELAMPAGWSVREAVPGDAATVLALQARALAGVDLAGVQDEAWWRWRVGVDHPVRLSLAECDGRVGAVAWIGPGHPAVDGTATAVAGIAHDRLDGLSALLARAAGAGRPVVVEERGTHTAPVEPLSVRLPTHYGLYVRVPDVVALLDRLRPELSARLAASARAGSSGRLVVSTYVSSFVVAYEAGEVVAVTARTPDEAAAERPAAGVPPDLVATLVFGRYGAAGLAERHDDVRLERAADLMATLFPRLRSDVALVL